VKELLVYFSLQHVNERGGTKAECGATDRSIKGEGVKRTASGEDRNWGPWHESTSLEIAE
jgi:hypothetical protein